ncbi:MAG: glycine cleavage system aminomethyltransferase GcvT [Paludibacteraceae bacterium]|nr:glycine cleavage system aminomethyltransferase GcvT [Paludibacteraceae bacterium]
MKTTPFTNLHEKAGARMAPFAGYNMPIEYPSGIINEHVAVRSGVGVFDVSHMGEIWVKGPYALDLLQKVTTNDVAKLQNGKIQYTCLPNGKGGIVDDLILYKYADEKYLVVPNASNIDKVFDWFKLQNEFGADLDNASDRIAQLAIQGPKALQALQKLTDVDLSAINYFSFVTAPFAGCNDVIISATGYTGAGGFELYMHNHDAVKIWHAIFDAGAEFDIKPIGLAARDTLRLEMGYCLYGNDIDDTTSPIEANLSWITKFVSHKNFIDKDLLAKQKAEGTGRLLKGFVMEEKGIPRHGYEIVNEKGELVGVVTSGTMSPVLKQGIGMGYINKGYNDDKATIYIKIRNKAVKATVTNPPFINNL